MKPIFISYSSKHRDLTRALAAAIEKQYGRDSVWWDYDLESRGSYSKQIKAAPENARVVVVIWTTGAMVSDYVYAEAVGAQAAGKLVNVRPADIGFRQIPEPFNIHHVDNAEEHGRILSTIAKVMAGTPIQTRAPLRELYFRQYGYRLIDPKQRPLAGDPSEISPTDLLQAKYAVVPYVDVTGMKADLIAWCDGGARATAARLVHGPGGLGKTRLMIEVAAAQREKGWTAGFLDRPHVLAEGIVQQRWQALDQLIAHGDDSGLLIVMDYAEARQQEVRDIAEVLSRRPDADARPIRLVLLTRSAGDWWTALHDETPEIERLFRGGTGRADVIALQPIATPRQRRELFFASALAMRPTLVEQGYVIPAGEPSPDRLARVEGASHARPLAVQMEALLWLASARPETGAIGVEGLLQRVLGLERAHWRKLLLGTLDEDRVRDIARAVAQVTAVQGTGSKPSTEALLMADGFYAGQRRSRVAVDPIVRDLSRLYGKPDSGVASLEPDLIGEHHVAAVGDEDLIDGCLAWIAAQPAETQEKRRHDLLTILQRATQPEHGGMARQAEALLDYLVRRHMLALAADMVAVMVNTPGTLAHCADRRLNELDDGALAAIDVALPRQSLALMDLSLRVAARRADVARVQNATVVVDLEAAPTARHESLNELAGRINNLGFRLFNVGRREAALAASQESVAIRRRLAETRPDAFLPDLSSSLNSLGVRLAALGRRDEALATSRESVAIYRRLAETRPDAFLPDLAMSRNNLGRMLSDLGRHEEALSELQGAVAINRRLAEAQPDAFLPGLAGSLHNSGATLSNLGRREDALAASQEAVDIYRRLAEARLDAFLPDRARSLNDLGIRLSELGRGEEALAASQEAVDISKHLTEARPDAFLPDLARSLHNLGVRLTALGRLEEAMAASQQAVSIRRRLAETFPDAFLPDLAMSLSNLGIRLSKLGRHEDALAASQEAVDVSKHLAEARPEAFLPDLARSVHNLGIRLSNVGRREEALAALQQAVDINRRLAGARPDAFLPNLAMSLSAVSQVLAAVERFEDAVVLAREGLATIVPFAERHPQAFKNLTRTLSDTYSTVCEKAGIEPDMALLERIARALGAGGSATDEPEEDTDG